MAENGVSIYSILQNPIKDPNDSQVPVPCTLYPVPCTLYPTEPNQGPKRLAGTYTHWGSQPHDPAPCALYPVLWSTYPGAPNPSLSPAFFSPAFFSPASFSPASFSPAFFSPAFFSHSPVLRSCPHGGKFVVMTDPVDVSAVKAACVKIEAADWCLGESFYMPVL